MIRRRHQEPPPSSNEGRTNIRRFARSTGRSWTHSIQPCIVRCISKHMCFFFYWYKVKWLCLQVYEDTPVGTTVYTLIGKVKPCPTLSTLTFKAPRWTNRTGNGPTLIFSRTRKVLVYSTPSAAIISVWTQILEKSHSLRYVLAFCP